MAEAGAWGQAMHCVEFILYVADQARSRDFYQAVLGLEPRLDVPGMTEFELNAGAVLGLMPAAGIRRLLGDTIADPLQAGQIPRCELYLPAGDPQAMVEAVAKAGGRLVSPAALRNWGELVAYATDPDGHLLAFARCGSATDDR